MRSEPSRPVVSFAVFFLPCPSSHRTNRSPRRVNNSAPVGTWRVAVFFRSDPIPICSSFALTVLPASVPARSKLPACPQCRVAVTSRPGQTSSGFAAARRITSYSAKAEVYSASPGSVVHSRIASESQSQRRRHRQHGRCQWNRSFSSSRRATLLATVGRLLSEVVPADDAAGHVLGDGAGSNSGTFLRSHPD